MGHHVVPGHLLVVSSPSPWQRGFKRGLYGLVFLLTMLWVLDRCFPPPIPDPFASAAQLVVARDGTPLRAFADQRGVWRYPVRLADVSPTYLDTLLSYEDRWFYRHPGVNPAALLRAVGQSIWHGRIVSGGSTLTMQVARLIEPIPHSAGGKLWQMVRALQLEWRLSKDQILELYLNLAPFGGNIEGVQAASYAYLGKAADRLSLAESALLAVLPQSPSRLRPDRHAQRAQAARDKVLDRLADFGHRSAAQIADARIEAVSTRSLSQPMLAPLLAERLRRSHPQRSRIQSTIDAEWQRVVERRVASYMDRFPPATSAAALVVDNATGEVRVYVGTAAFGDPRRLGHIDMIQAQRSPGSALKPFLYGMVLDAGLIHSESLLIDAPQSFGGYAPGNFHEAFNGPVSAAQALRLSLNVPAVDLLDRIGPARFHAALDHAGLQLAMPDGAVPNLSLILGGSGARLDELTSLYRGLSQAGQVMPLRYTPDDPSEARWLHSPGAAWIVRSMLSERSRSRIESELFDPGRNRQLAWKTGTSYGFRDAWALATTDSRTIGVWIGRPDGTPVPGSFGVVSALPLLLQIDQALPQLSTSRAPERPASASRATICWPLGGTVSDTAPELCQRRHEAWLLDRVAPPTLPPREQSDWLPSVLEFQVDPATGKRLAAACMQENAVTRRIARWPALLAPWLSSRSRRLSTPPPLKAGCGPDPLREQQLVIEGVRDGVLLTPAGGSGPMIELSLRALGSAGAPVQWLLNERPVGSSTGDGALRLELRSNGRHRLIAIDAAGRHGALEFAVRGVLTGEE